MHPDLPGLAAKAAEVLSRRSEYVVTQPAELRILREMSDAEVSDFAKNHGWRIIRRLGGRQIEFYNDASVRALYPGSGIPLVDRDQVGRVNALRYSNAGQQRSVGLPSARSKWKRQRFISLFLA